MPDWFRHVLVGLVTVGTLGAMRLLFERRSPKSFDGQHGRIGPGKTLALIVILGGAGMAALGIGVDAGWPGLALAVMGIACVLLTLPSLTNWHDVIWDVDGVEGPSRTFLLTLGRARTKIAWDKIVRIGSTWSGYDYIETGVGQRVYWNQYYSGYGRLLDAIEREQGRKVPGNQL